MRLRIAGQALNLLGPATVGRSDIQHNLAGGACVDGPGPCLPGRIKVDRHLTVRRADAASLELNSGAVFPSICAPGV